MTPSAPRPWSALVAALVLAVAACGSDDSSTVDDASDTASASVADEPAESEPDPAPEPEPENETEPEAEPESEIEPEPEPEAEPEPETEPETESEPEPEPEPETEPESEAPAELTRPAQLDGEVVVAFGSNVWPVVEDLLVVGIAPDVIVRNEGSQDAPAYLTDRFGDEIAAAEMFEMNLLNPSIETFAAVGGDVLAVPREFEPFLTAELLDLFDTVVFTKLDDWRVSVGSVVENTGADPSILDALEAEYDARVTEVQAATSLDLASLSLSVFAINNVQVSPDSRNSPGAAAAVDVGLRPVDAMQDVPTRENPLLSLEEITQMDADLVFFNVRSTISLDELEQDPLWQTTDAFANGTVYPGVSEWRQAGFLGTMTVFDELERALLDYESKGL
ncbi:MAG: ABC transporter substrate-binding protein [Actinomycetota bacterium]